MPSATSETPTVALKSSRPAPGQLPGKVENALCSHCLLALPGIDKSQSSSGIQSGKSPRFVVFSYHFRVLKKIKCTRSELYEAPTDADCDCLCAVGGSELLHHMLDVDLHGLF